ncbi:MAG: tetratricopeptide repeat protein [Candidatus Acidiferrales bacterium]
MARTRFLTGLLLLLGILAPASMAQLGKTVLIPAGSDEDHQLTAINAASDPGEKLKLIDEFSKGHPDDDFQIIADEQYVNYYINAKQYDKAFEYGDKLWARDPENYANGVNMVRAANEMGDPERLFSYGEKTAGILQRYKASPAPEGTPAQNWDEQKVRKLEQAKENQDYVEQSLLSAAYQPKEPAKRADLLARFAKTFPDSPNAQRALIGAAYAYQQAQDPQKMLELVNGVLAKDPNNVGMLLATADIYSEAGTQLDKAEEYAKKVGPLCDAAKKPENVSEEEWKKQNDLQKGLALSALGQVSLQKKDSATAVKNLLSAAQLLKADATSYARNQYRLGYAYVNLKKKPEAIQAFTDAASVDSPYKETAAEKAKELAALKPAPKRKPQ